MALKFYDQEDILDALIALLQAKLPDAITEMNVLKDDAYKIVLPVGYWFGLRLVDPKLKVGSFVIVASMNLIEGTNFNQGETDSESTYDIIVIYWGARAEEVERKLLRYAKTLRKVFDDNQIFSELVPPADNIKDSVVSLIDFNPADFQGDVYMKSATVRIRVKDTWTYDIN